jgi:hypothetical protein
MSAGRARRARRAGGNVLFTYVTDCETEAQQRPAKRNSCNHQITQRSLLTIGLPSGAFQVFWNSGMLARVPFTR